MTGLIGLNLPALWAAGQQVEENKQRSRLLDLQIAQTQQAAAQKTAQGTTLSTLYGGLDPATGISWDTARPGLTTGEQTGMLASAFPETFATAQIKAMMPKDPKDYIISLGDGTGANIKDPNNPILFGNTGMSYEGDAPGTNLMRAAPTAPAPTAAGAPDMDLFMRANRIRETGGSANPSTARNPNSSAEGADQFTASTWIETLKENAPGIIETTVGKNADLKDPAVQQALQDLRRDDRLSGQMAQAYARKNADVLSGAGLEASPRNLVVAHFLGGSGATRFLQADPGSPATSAVSAEAAAANRNVFFDKSGRARTVAEVLAQADGVVQQAQAAGGGGGAPAVVGADDGARFAVEKGLLVTKGLPAGYAWAKRDDGKRVAKRIPGTPDPEARQQAEFDLRRQTEARQAEKDAQEREAKLSGTQFDQETKLRTEYQNSIKGFDTAQQNFAAMPELAKDDTGGSDIALINAFFKTFAPDSTVMEGEFASVGKAAGLSDRLVGALSKAAEGTIMTASQRAALIQAAGRFYQQRKREVASTNERFEKLARDGYKLDPSRVVLNPIRPDEPDPAAWQQVALPADVTLAGRMGQLPGQAPAPVRSAPVTGAPGQGVVVPVPGAALPPGIPPLPSPNAVLIR